MSKRINIFTNFFTIGSQAILVFHNKRDGNIPTRTPLTGASNAVGQAEIAILTLYLATLRAEPVNVATG